MTKTALRTAALLALLLVPGQLGFAQQTMFRNYTVQDGLSQSQVETIIQDHDGYLWAGTHHGLSRFDGQSFTNFTKKDGLLENGVTASLLDRQGRLWFGHHSGGISQFDGRDFVQFPPSPQRDGYEITSMLEDASGRIWAGTAGAGILVRRASEPGVGFASVEGMPQIVHALYLASDILWIGSSEGLFVASLAERGIHAVRVEARELDGKQIRALWQDDEGELWIGTAGSGLFVLRPAAGLPAAEPSSVITVEGLPDAPVEHILGDDHGQVWVATDGEGLWTFAEQLNGRRVSDLKTYSVEEGLSYDEIKEIIRDREGNLWFAIYGGGISSYKGCQFQTTRHSDNPRVLGVWSVVEDRRGAMWFGTDGGLVRFTESVPGKSKASSITFTTADGLSHDSVRAVLEDDHGYLWLATKGGGLNRFDPVTAKVEWVRTPQELPTDDLLSIVGGEQGDIWIGTYGHGVVRYFPPSHGDLGRDPGRFEHYPLSGDKGIDVYAMFRDHTGKIWAGASELGLAEFVPSEIAGRAGRFKVYGEEFGIQHRAIGSIAEDQGGVLWVSADDGGLYTFDGERYTDIGTGSALEGENVYLVACDKNNDILAGTNYGLYKYDRTTQRFTYFGRDEGFWASRPTSTPYSPTAPAQSGSGRSTAPRATTRTPTS